MGRSVVWASQTRETVGTTMREAMDSHLGHTVITSYSIHYTKLYDKAGFALYAGTARLRIVIIIGMGSMIVAGIGSWFIV